MQVCISKEEGRHDETNELKIFKIMPTPNNGTALMYQIAFGNRTGECGTLKYVGKFAREICAQFSWSTRLEVSRFRLEKFCIQLHCCMRRMLEAPLLRFLLPSKNQSICELLIEFNVLLWGRLFFSRHLRFWVCTQAVNFYFAAEFSAHEKLVTLPLTIQHPMVSRCRMKCVPQVWKWHLSCPIISPFLLPIWKKRLPIV